MPDSLPQRLLANLQPWLSAPGFWVALSGGLDSTVLLHLLVTLRREHRLPPIRAVHVHHGLQQAAEDWVAHCARLCAALDVELAVERVNVRTGASLEAQARAARYEALAKHLEAGEVLLTAQHRDDQAETVLYRLVRGSGLRGLCGMAPSRPFSCGVLLRPLLDVTRAELERYARAHRLDWIDDPSNLDMDLSRNLLRRTVLPALQARWPQAPAAIARAADHLREADGLLGDLAELDLALARGGSPLPWLDVPNLALAPLRALSEARQRNALRHWLAAFSRMPDSAHWAGWACLRDAAVDRNPVWGLEGGELQRSRDRVWFVPRAWLIPAVAPVTWHDPARELDLPGNGRVAPVSKLLNGDLNADLNIRYRVGGETLLLPGRGRRDLKRLLSERGWPPFLRARIPLLYRGDELIAVANLTNDETGHPVLRWSPDRRESGLSW
ncbi:tRNA lysidine(34) synthetase TilS [Stutzerimonas urumqiensis]|uniref:tRNA lysidine(34) synthetase TilS n=1 Tax=Stutzerimonas urumqiensis TaxID=638269 RepID=UPI003DA56B41